jgi:hypothetical protein
MSRNHPKFWQKTGNNSGIDQSSIVRYNGNTIPKGKLLGKRKKN